MAITDITLSQLDPRALTMAKAGLTPSLTVEQNTGYNLLFEILSGGEWNSDESPVHSVFNGKIYLPKVYQRNGEPLIQWGTNLLALVESDKLNYSYSTANTGYSGPHVVILFTEEATVKKAKTLYKATFPVATESGENISSSFLSLVAVQENEALAEYVRRPDPTTGLRWLDESVPEGTKEINVEILDAVTRKGSEEFGGKLYPTATVKASTVHPTEVFKVRTNSDANATLQGPLKFPLNAPGVVRLAKKNLNLQDITLTEANIDFDMA